MSTSISTLDSFVARKAATWLTQTDEQGNLKVNNTSDYILSCVQAFHDAISRIDIEPIIRIITTFAIQSDDKALAHKATQAMLDVVRFNDSLSYYGNEIGVFDTAIDEYLASRRAETNDPDYPI